MVILSVTSAAIFIAAVMIMLGLMMFPFLLHRKVHYTDELEKSLIVKSDNVKDARYFAKSFQKKIKEIASEKVENAVLSKDEVIKYYDGSLDLDNQVKNICYIIKDSCFNKKHVFMKEVYSEGDIIFAPDSKIRAVAGEKKIFIGENTVIERWADAEKLIVVEKKSNAGVNLSSGRMAVIDIDCEFKRLYAPVIRVGEYKQGMDDIADNVVVYKTSPVYMKIIRNIEKIGLNQEERHTIVTVHNLSLEPGSVVYGDIKSEKDIRIKARAVVTGNVFADGNVIIEPGARILGNVFAGKNLYIGPSVVIGKLGRIKSALSRENLVIAEGAVVYGYAGCENKGKTVGYDRFFYEAGITKDESIISGVKDRTREFGFEKCNITDDGILDMNEIKDFDEIDYYAFRKCKLLKKVVLPEGMVKTGESMFFGCENLEEVILPASLEKIDNYTFCGCSKLRRIISGNHSRLKTIGDYAFAKCDMLDCTGFDRIEEIGYAAFWK